mgnify:CR=1 FL=1|tara:strand:- start:21829 stop:22362 length:534 start_codon:yes stop_codon:yes gene_type:complete
MRWKPIDTVYGKEVLIFIGMGSVVACFVLILPFLGTKRINSMQLKRQSNMRSIVTVMRNYVAEHDGQLIPPERWHEFVDPFLGVGAEDPVYFPEYDSQFFILPIPWEDHQLPMGLDDRKLRKIPFLVEEQHLHEEKTFVAFWGGSVRGLSDKEFAEKIDLTNAVPIGRRVSREDTEP